MISIAQILKGIEDKGDEGIREGVTRMTNYIMLAIGCLLVGASQNGMVPNSWIGSVLCLGIVTIVWSIIWDR